ncbi:hypothetical protein DV532_25220 (plasmid) [Pseudomonas sp. Leaf58]|uniref:hypothetical protein n=1 Tax=Pseudomonas sp. Leaf58 TaxID=1736226 RepID=UPI0006FCFC58|nr:hypothetical protein [Pseudomonas sp. Leaf58]AYG47602.1 hypothetical protein DV532_25220 [Pseudomonas sp. Leaf58]KQN61955.1 hypothetical protein ASF02_07140 [Pseudomonas sp. Leaf58]
MPSNTSSPENIILYPHSYNKRGDESLHSVQGVTADGEEVNVKLRVASKYASRDGTPSIAEFAREDYGAKNACIATPDNSPTNRQGILLFTGCEPDGENRKGITSYIARWAYRLVADGDSPAPIIGIGRIHVAEETSRNRGIRTDIEALQQAKPIGWEARVVRLEQDLNDATRFAYSLRLYQYARTRMFPSADTKAWEQWIIDVINTGGTNSTVTGVFVRARLSSGKYLPEIDAELIPIWNPRDRRYQNGAEIVSWLHKLIPELAGIGDDVSLVIMPVECHIAGQVFKKFYGEPKNFQKLKQQYYPGGRAELSLLAASQSLHDGSPLLLRVHPLGGPMGPAMKLNEHGDFLAQVVGEAGDEPGEVVEKIVAGLNFKAPMFFPSWFEPTRVLIDENDLPMLHDLTVEESDPDAPQETTALDAGTFTFATDPEMLDELVIVDDITEVSPSPGVDSEPPSLVPELSSAMPASSESVADQAFDFDNKPAPAQLPAPVAAIIVESPSEQATACEDGGVMIMVMDDEPALDPVNDHPSEVALDEPDASWAFGSDDEPVLTPESEMQPTPIESGNATMVPAEAEMAVPEGGTPAVPPVSAPVMELLGVGEPALVSEPSPALEFEPELEPQMLTSGAEADGLEQPEVIVDKMEPAAPPQAPGKKPKGLAGFLAKRGLA